MVNMWKNNAVSRFFIKALCLICLAVFFLSACGPSDSKSEKEVSEKTAGTVSKDEISGNVIAGDPGQPEISKEKKGGEATSSSASSSPASASKSESRSAGSDPTQTRGNSSQNQSSDSGSGKNGGTGSGNSSTLNPAGGSDSYNEDLDGEYVED